MPPKIVKHITLAVLVVAVSVVAYTLTKHWLPLGPGKGLILNLIFVVIVVGGVLGFFRLFQMGYGHILAWSLNHKFAVLSFPFALIIIGSSAWLGFDTITGWMPSFVQQSGPFTAFRHAFPGLGKEFMPPLDEGSFLYMPTTMPHASIGEGTDILHKQNMALHAIPEIDTVVGKLGRAETPLDPAPVSMIETVINYKPEYILDQNGKRMTFRFASDETDLFRNENGEPIDAHDGEPYTVQGRFMRDEDNRLIPDKHGTPFRLWRLPLDPDLNPGRKDWAGIASPDKTGRASASHTFDSVY